MALPFAPLFFLISRLTLFFNAVIQIYIFLLIIIYTQLIWSLIDTHYRRNASDLRLYRMLGYGAHPNAGLLPYRFLGLEHWAFTLALTLLVMIVARYGMVYLTLDFYSLKWEDPGFSALLIVALGIAISIALGVYFGLVAIWTGVPKGNSFAAPKVKIERVDKLGLDPIWVISGMTLLFYGLVAFIFIPESAVLGKDSLQTSLFNSIFFLMYVGIITLFNLAQGPV